METIKTYLDNMFRSWPDTEEVRRIRGELLSDMADKYNEMKASGKSENEAVGIVISEFGNIDELMQEMGVSRQAENFKGTDRNLRHVGREEAEAFLHIKEANGKRVGCGVAAILFGVAGLILLSAAAEYMPGGEEGFSGHILGLGGLILLFFCIIVGVALFIYSGTLEDKYKYLEKAFRIDDSLRSELEMRREDEHSGYMVSVIAGVALCIASAIPVVTAGFLADDNDFLGSIAVTVTLMLVAAAVYLFVSFGEKKEAYDKLLQEGEYTVEKKKKKGIISIVATVVWPLVTIVYLLRGFTAGEWGTAWVIYPVTGILFGIFSAVVNKAGSLTEK